MRHVVWQIPRQIVANKANGLIWFDVNVESYVPIYFFDFIRIMILTLTYVL